MERSISVADYKNLFQVASAWIACIDFSDPIPKSLSDQEFADRLWSAPSRCREASELLAQALAYDSPGLLLGRPLRDIFPAHRGFSQLFQSWVSQGFSRSPMIATVRDGENKSLVVQCVVYPTFVEERLERIWVICRDITASERARETLELAERHYRSLVERPGLILVRVDAAGYYTYVSPCAKEMFGMPSFDLGKLPELVAERIHPNDLPAFETLARAVAAHTTTSVEVEYRIKQPDGIYHWYFSRLTPKLNSRDEVEYYDVLALDIEQHKQVELERRHSQRLELLGSLAAGVAHDLNNHLTAVLGALGAALSELENQAVSPAIEQINAAEQAALGCAEMTRRFLNFGRRNTDETSVVNLAQVAKDALLLARHILPPQVTAIVSTEEVPLFVRANVTQMHQVMMNLVTNARDAMPDGGRIDICVARSQPGPYGKNVELTVSDTGSGMTAETLQRIFEPFFTTKVPGKGTGLGLSLVQAIVREFGGTVEVRSTLGVGTTFRLSFPACELPGTSASPPRAADVIARGGHILVADDDDLVRGMLVSVLTKFGFQVTAATDGGQALEIFPSISTQITCAIVDVTMPRLSGVVVAQRLRAQCPSLPIILSSGNMVNAAQTIGGLMLLPKPYTLDTLLSMVRSVHAAIH